MMHGEASGRGAILPLALASAAAQTLLMVLTPSIVAVADDLGSSLAVIGQARTVTAGVALVVSLVLLTVLPVIGLRRVLAGGALSALAAAVAVATAAGVLAYLLAHVLVGIAVGALLSAGFSGLAGFSGAARARAAGWVTAAAGGAWALGIPIIGFLTEQVSWRATHAVPAALAAAVLLMSGRSAALASGSRTATLTWIVRHRRARRWLIAETLANIGWTSTLTFVGAVLVAGLGVAETATGWLLALGAGAFVAASLLGGRLAAVREPRTVAIASSALLAAATLGLFGTAALPEGWLRIAAAATAFALAAAAAGVRIPASSVLGMAQEPDRAESMSAVRAASMQLGYLIGAPLSGVVIAGAGWPALGFVLALLLAGAASISSRLAAAGRAAEGRLPAPVHEGES